MKINHGINQIEEQKAFLGPFRLICSMITKGEPTLKRALDSAMKCCDEIYVTHNDDVDISGLVINSQATDLKHINLSRKEWNNDFSEQRNYCLDLARSHEKDHANTFVLWLDSDDEIDDLSVKAIRSLKLGKTKLPPDTKEIMVNCASNGAETIPQMRIFKLEGAKWYGKIHENINYLIQDGKTVSVPNITITHHGYENKEVCMEKAQRNLDILQNEQPSANSMFETARAHMSSMNYLLALENLFLARDKGFNNPIVDFYIAECLSEITTNGTIRTLLEESAESIPDAQFRLGEHLAINGNYKQSIKTLLTYITEAKTKTSVYGSMYDTFSIKAMELIKKCLDNV